MVCFVETVPGCECVEGALCADWAVGAHFDCVESVGVYWLGVGEDWVTVAWWFLLHKMLYYTTIVILGNIQGEPHTSGFAFYGGVDGGHDFGHVVGCVIRYYPGVYDAVT